MPVVVKRIKVVETKIGDVVTKTESVHWATKVEPAGNVTGWVADRGAATSFPAALGRKVTAYYAGRANAGTITVESVGDEPEEPAVPVPVITLTMAQMEDLLAGRTVDCGTVQLTSPFPAVVPPPPPEPTPEPLPEPPHATESKPRRVRHEAS